MKTLKNASQIMTHRQWRIALLVSTVVTFGMLTTGCSAAWVSEAQQLVQTIALIVGSITSILTAVGVKLSAALSTELNTIETDASNELTAIGPLLTEYAATPSATTLAKITNALNVVKGGLTTLLSGIAELSPAVQTKIAAIATLVINTVEEIFNLLPKSTASTLEAHIHFVKIGDFFNAGPVKKLKTAYNGILDAPSGDAAADAVFAKVPHL